MYRVGCLATFVSGFFGIIFFVLIWNTELRIYILQALDLTMSLMKVVVGEVTKSITNGFLTTPTNIWQQ